MIGCERVALSVQRKKALALTREADAKPPGVVLADLREIKGVERLPEFEHDVVGHVHDVVDRAQPCGFQLFAQPVRAGADLHAPDAAGRVERRGGGGLQRDCGSGSGFRNGVGIGTGREHAWRERKRLPKQRRDLPGHADVAQQIGPVRGDLHVEHRFRRVKLADRRAGAGFGRQNQQPVGVVGDPEFLPAAKHPLALHAAQLAHLDLEIAREHRSGQRERHLVARLVVLRPADDLARLAGAIIHAADAQPVGVGVRGRFEDLRDHHLVDRRAALLHPLYLHARLGQQLAERRRVGGQFHQFF